MWKTCNVFASFVGNHSWILSFQQSKAAVSKLSEPELRTTRLTVLVRVLRYLAVSFCDAVWFTPGFSLWRVPLSFSSWGVESWNASNIFRAAFQREKVGEQRMRLETQLLRLTEQVWGTFSPKLPRTNLSEGKELRSGRNVNLAYA